MFVYEVIIFVLTLAHRESVDYWWIYCILRTPHEVIIDFFTEPLFNKKLKRYSKLNKTLDSPRKLVIQLSFSVYKIGLEALFTE